jgi:hypothetical protein
MFDSRASPGAAPHNAAAAEQNLERGAQHRVDALASFGRALEIVVASQRLYQFNAVVVRDWRAILRAQALDVDRVVVTVSQI